MNDSSVINKVGQHWTADQQEAINTTDKGVIVSAAAGSGKTAVLVERTIRLLCDEKKRIPADSLLAVTFTKDAANQMKTKLSKALDKKLAENPDNSWISEQRDNLCLAKIMTINAFCLDLVNSNIHEFELESNIKILDDVDSAIIFNQSMDEAFEYFYENDPNMMNDLIDRLTENNEVNLKLIVRKLYYFLRSLPFADMWYKNAIKNLKSDNAVDNYVDQICEYYLNEIDKALTAAERFSAVLCDIPECDKQLKNRTFLDNDISAIEGLKNVVKTKDWTNIYHALVNIQIYTKGIRMRVNAKDDDGKREQKQKLNIIKACYSEYKEIITTLKSDIQNIGLDIADGIKDTAILFESLCLIYKKLEEIVWEKKLEKNSLDFSDVEIMSINLLIKHDEHGNCVRTELAEEIVNKKLYQVILIDEFQDVNNLQDLIFKAISDTKNLDIMGSNVFVVGDVKQSIYRFRQSNPLLFINAKEAASSEEFENLKLIILKQNFRSRKNILDFVNYTFSMLMSREVGEIEYNSNEMLNLGAKYDGDDFDTEILIVDPKSEENNIPEYLNFDIEHYAVACKIQELIDNHQQVFDVNKKTFRNCIGSDFCVLARDNTHGQKMANALSCVGLKAYTEDLEGYLRAREIAVMINLLKVIDNPMHDMELVSVLMSPIFGFSADDMAKIKLLCKNEDGYPIRIYQCINAFSDGQEKDKYEDEEHKLDFEVKINDEALKQKGIRASECIKRLRFYSSGMTIEQLIRKIYDETDFFAVASNFENSKQTRANLRLLLEYATAYEKNSNGGIPGFLRYIESAEKYEGKFKQAVTVIQDSDSVIVKTIHKSKGLEFPFVFLCGLSKKMRFDEEQQPVIFNEKNGISMQLLNHKELTKTKTINYLLMQKSQHNETLSEELRLLYVAMTRAKEKLFITLNKASASGLKKIVNKLLLYSDQNEKDFSIDPSIISQCNNFSQWIHIILLFAKKNEKILEYYNIDDEFLKVDSGSEITYTFFDEPFKESRDIQHKQIFDNAYVKSTTDDLVSKYDFEYHSEEIDKPSKITVTEIVRDEKEREYAGENPEFYPKLPRIADEIDKLTSAEKGTYTHLFMELADFENASKSVEDELDRLSKGGFLSPAARSGVYINAVKKFFESDLYKRLAKSDEVIREKDFLVAFRDLNLPAKYDSIVSEHGMLQGVADCLFKEDDGYVLIDYKTDNFKDRSELLKYQTQLELYKASLDLLMDMPIKSCYIYSFKLCDGVEILLK